MNLWKSQKTKCKINQMAKLTKNPSFKFRFDEHVRCKTKVQIGVLCHFIKETTKQSLLF